MSDPLVSILVPTFNNQDTILQCLQSLAAQTMSNFEVLVVNDGSSDETAARIAKLVDSRFRLFHTPRRRGPGAARNVALRELRAPYVAFIDGDMSAPPGWLETLLAPVLAGEADCTGGPDVVPGDAPLLSRCIGYSMDSLLSGGLRHGTTRLVTYLPGTGNLLLRREVIDQVGPFNEAFFDTGEDKEFLYRVRRAGARIQYVSSALLWHHRVPDYRQHVRKMVTYGRRRVDIWRLQPDTFEWPHVLPAVLVVAALVALLLPDGETRRWGWGLAGLLVGLDAATAAWVLRDVRALLVAPLTSSVVPLGYGLGIVTQWVRP